METYYRNVAQPTAVATLTFWGVTRMNHEREKEPTNAEAAKGYYLNSGGVSSTADVSVVDTDSFPLLMPRHSVQAMIPNF